MSTNSSQHTANSTRTSNFTSGVSNSVSDGNWDGKPTLPYTIGTSFTAYRHIPPPPFGHGYSTPWPPFKTPAFLRLSQVDYVLSRSPMPSHTLSESRTLRITGLLRTGYFYSAQVVVVNGDMVAKIYDPLYDNGFDGWDNKRDVVVLAEGDYTREAAAYEELLKPPADDGVREVTPKYFGSWTIEVNTSVGDRIYTRSVRLILMQYVEGSVMNRIDACSLDREKREGVMRKVLEAESLVFAAGVHHRDISPRNVVITSSAPRFDDLDLRVVIIDLNVSNVLRLSTSCHNDINHDKMERKWPGRILGPVTKSWDGLQEFEVKGWVPDRVGEANEWLWRAFGEREDYVKLVREGDEYPRIACEDENRESREVEGVAGCMCVDKEDEDEDEDVVVFRGRGR